MPFTATGVQKCFPACVTIHLSNYTLLQHIHNNVLNSELYLRYFIQCLSIFFTWLLSSRRNNALRSQHALLYIWIIMIWHSRGNMLHICQLILRSRVCWTSSMCDKSKAFPCMKVILERQRALKDFFTCFLIQIEDNKENRLFCYFNQ